MMPAATLAAAAPRPTRLHYVAALTAILLGLTLLLTCTTIAFWHRDPMLIISAIVVGAFVVPLVRCQYRGTFLHVARSARIATGLHYGFALFALLFYFTTIGEFVAESRDGMKIAVVLWPVLLAGLPAAAAGRSNQLWTAKLRTAATADSASQPPISTARRRRGAAIVFALSAAGAAYLVHRYGPPYAEHVAAGDAPFALPAAATDVCYARGSRGLLYYEFSIDEPGFREWIDDFYRSAGPNRPQLAEISDVMKYGDPCEIRRYTSLANLPGDRYARVTDGLCFARHNQDQRRQAVYDRAARRAYFTFAAD